MISPQALASVRVLFRAPYTLALHGVPYAMRPGQSPRDLWRAREAYVEPRPGRYGGAAKVSLDDWIWLGSPGWWGHLTPEERALVEAYLARVKAWIPGYAWEWSEVKP